ncbi:TetR/AcrR family transcriptional regulator [Telmatospirillum sp.]|uniref:TetR/AcrR family transcriptional regulator n=1 Tax=Telmatospirillum sp. TaxID=2079197 RepID=UPI00283B905A|nr:TetR/AcrR family transcriptional regulator [Telmatospirillum sp.]MDR3439690.1 TetR/AcrR family transcriptional regulator [Telmatospirillum sp.]
MKTVFRENGYDGASMADLAAKTGLAKAALYHHFPGGKEDMAAAVLDEISGWMKEHVLGPLSVPGVPREKLRRLSEALNEFYDGGQSSCLIGAFSIGEAMTLFQGRLGAAVRGLMAAIAKVLIEAEIPERVALSRAEDAVIRIQGALVVARALRDTRPFTRLLRRLPDDLLSALPDAVSDR